MKKLTLTAIRQFPRPVKGFTEFSVGSVTGLRVRVMASGIRSWVFKYKQGGKLNVITLGRVEGMPVKDAEHEAHRLRNLIAAGRDPVAEQRQERERLERERLEAARVQEANPLFSAFAADFIERYAKRNKKSWQEDERELRLHILPVLGELRLQDIKRRDIVVCLDAMRDGGITTRSNRTRSLLHKMFNWAISKALIEYNPVTHTERLKEKSRDRVLTDDEIRRLWAGTGDTMSGLALRFVLLSAKRPGEVMGLRWSDIRDDVIRLDNTKNGTADMVPVSAGLWAVLDDVRKLAGVALSGSSNGFVFTGKGGKALADGTMRQTMRRIDWDGELSTHPHPHDLRRTAATTVSRLGHGRIVISKLLNHVDSSVDGIYDRWGYMPEKLKALDDLWAEVQRIVGLNVLVFPSVANAARVAG